MRRFSGENGFDLLKKYYRDHPDFDYVVKDKIPADLLYSGGVNSNQKIKFDFLERIGYLPVAGDAHTAEFFRHFLAEKKSAIHWGVGEGFHTFAREGEVESRKQKALKLLAGDEPLFLEHSHEHASKIIAALATGKELLTPVNTANIGQIDNLPRGVVVETMANIDSLGIHPISIGSLPDVITQYLMKHIPVQEMIVEAGLTGDKDLAIQALSCDQMIPDPGTAEQIANDFFAEFKDSLPQFNGKWKLDSHAAV